MVLLVMEILKSAIVFVLFTTATCTENKKKTVTELARDKHGHHDHDHHDHNMYYGDSYLYKYLLFFAVKLKIIFVIVTIFTVVIVGGKIMALIYYLKTKNKGISDGVDCVSDTQPEKIVYASPPHHHGYKYAEPSASHHHKYESHQPPDYQVDESQTQETHESPPDIYEERYGIASKHKTKQYPLKNTYNPYGLKYSTIDPVILNEQLSIHGGRSVRSIDGKIDEKINKIADFIMRMDTKDDITNTTLNFLKLNSISCRKRFVCEAFHLAKSNSLVAVALQLLSSTKLMKYKDNEDVLSLEECEKKYPQCILGKVS